jgi:zinc transport system substrate-binding protein
LQQAKYFFPPITPNSQIRFQNRADILSHIGLNIVTKHFCLAILLLVAGTSTPVLSEPLRIVASIKPVHSIVASITDGITEPELLMHSNRSPHHYSLKPSERRLLANADLIFWIGPTMESFMPRILNSLEDKSKAVSLIQTQGLKLLSIRQPSHTDDDEHNHETDHEHSTMDAHIWLDTHNVDVLVDAISKEIIRIDPEHQQQYETNTKQLHDRISQLRKTLKQSLDTVNKFFLTYHDGYQYFEKEFNLNNRGFISSSELQPGARHISELKKLIKQQNIQCIFYDAPTEPPVLKTLLDNTKTRTYMLDPVGILIPPGKNTWFEIMDLLGKQFINCQQNL